MKLKPLFISALILACAAICADETRPEHTFLTIHNMKVKGSYHDTSAYAPVVKTELQGDTLIVDIQTEIQGDGTLDFIIPEQAKKIRIFDCDFELPCNGETAYFRSTILSDIQPPWYRFQKSETIRAMTMIAIAPDKKSFSGQTYYGGNAGREVWTSCHNFSCVISADGSIFNHQKRLMVRDGNSGKPYAPCHEFKNQDGELFANFDCISKYYKRMHTVTQSLGIPVRLPAFRPELLTLFNLNKPHMEKYLLDNQAEKFDEVKTLAEFQRFCNKLEQLKQGMTREETSAILGIPDDSYISGTKGPNTKGGYGVSKYTLLRVSSKFVNMHDLVIYLHFERDKSGTFRLSKIY